MHSLILELQQGYVQEATYILVAKVRELTKLKVSKNGKLRYMTSE